MIRTNQPAKEMSAGKKKNEGEDQDATLVQSIVDHTNGPIVNAKNHKPASASPLPSNMEQSLVRGSSVGSIPFLRLNVTFQTNMRPNKHTVLREVSLWEPSVGFNVGPVPARALWFPRWVDINGGGGGG